MYVVEIRLKRYLDLGTLINRRNQFYGASELVAGGFGRNGHQCKSSWQYGPPAATGRDGAKLRGDDVKVMGGWIESHVP